MGHTNSTANLSLPQFIGTDKPTWLGDVNGAFLAIDGYVGTNDAAVAAAASDASSAISQASAAVNTANTANTTAGNASTAANNAVGVANTANAIAGTVDAKVGLLADLNTTDRSSIVNAINEVLTKSNHGIMELWANPDISVAFNATSIALDTTPYDAIIVEMSDAVGETTGAQLFMFDPASYGSPRNVSITSLVLQYGVVAREMRSVTVYNSSVDFGSGYAGSVSTYGSAGTESINDSVMIPVRILGLIHNN